MLPGHVGEQADADMAYCQTTFKGTETFVRLPRHRWPDHFHQYSDPVCPLELALYGHPESGYYWEEHCDEKLREEGFVPIQEWPGTYWHPKHKAMVIVYVDDSNDETIGETANQSHAFPARLHPRREDQHSLQKSKKP